MTHLQYSPTKGALSAKVKDNILDLMFKKSVGYLTAAEKLHIHPARAFAELRADKDFKALVEEAREVIAERLQDDCIRLSDEPATSRDAVANKALRLKTRWQVITSLLVRFNRPPGGTPNRLSGSVQVFNQQIILTPEQQEQLRSDRRALEAQANRLYPIEDAVIVNTESTPEGVARQDNGLQSAVRSTRREKERRRDYRVRQANRDYRVSTGCARCCRRCPDNPAPAPGVFRRLGADPTQTTR